MFDRRIMTVRDPRDMLISTLLFRPLTRRSVQRSDPDGDGTNSWRHSSARRLTRRLCRCVSFRVGGPARHRRDAVRQPRSRDLERQLNHPPGSFHVLRYEHFVAGELGELSGLSRHRRWSRAQRRVRSLRPHRAVGHVGGLRALVSRRRPGVLRLALRYVRRGVRLRPGRAVGAGSGIDPPCPANTSDRAIEQRRAIWQRCRHTGREAGQAGLTSPTTSWIRWRAPPTTATLRPVCGWRRRWSAARPRNAAAAPRCNGHASRPTRRAGGDGGRRRTSLGGIRQRGSGYPPGSRRMANRARAPSGPSRGSPTCIGRTATGSARNWPCWRAHRAGTAVQRPANWLPSGGSANRRMISARPSPAIRKGWAPESSARRTPSASCAA